MDATEVNSLFESNNIGEYLRAKFMDEFFAAMANNGPGDIDDNNKTNSGNVDGNRTHGTTNNGQTVDGLATEMRKLTNCKFCSHQHLTNGSTQFFSLFDSFIQFIRTLFAADFCLPTNVGAIKRHDRFATNHKERQQRPSLPTAQKNWSSKSPTGKEVSPFDLVYFLSVFNFFLLLPL